MSTVGSRQRSRSVIVADEETDMGHLKKEAIDWHTQKKQERHDPPVYKKAHNIWIAIITSQRIE